KRSLTALDLMAIVRELKFMRQSYLSNIYNISNSIFLFKFGGVFKGNLIFELGKRLSISSFDFEKPKSPSNFCRFLRGKFVRFKFLDVEQLNFDRVLSFKFDNDFSIVFELLDGGNIIVLDGDGRIVNVLYSKETRDRKLVNGEKYIPPPIRGFNPLLVGADDLYSSLMNSKGSLIASLTKVLNIPGEVAEEICSRCNLSKDLEARALGRGDAEHILDCFRDISSSIIDGVLNPQIILSDGRIVSVIPIDFMIYSNFDSEYFSNFNSAVDEYFFRLMNLEMEDLKVKVRVDVEGKFKAIISKHRGSLENMKVKAGKLRSMGRILMENTNLIDEILNSLKNYALRYGWGNVLNGIKSSKPELLNYIHDFNAKDRLVMIKLNGEIIPLNVLDSAANNASKLFDEAKDLEAKIERTIKAIEDLEGKMDLEVEEEFSRRIAKPIRVLGPPKRGWYENFHWFKSSDGILVVGGRDASQNEALVRKWLKDHHIYVHADVHGGPSVIILSETIPPEHTIYEASQLAVSFSNAWRASFEVSSAFWVYGHQVSKSPPSGEYLARGAFMIYGRKNYIHNIPLRVALGIIFEDDVYKVVSGPPSAISKWCLKSVTLAPGDSPLERIYANLKKLLSTGVGDDLKSFISNLSMDDLRRVLPRGGFRVMM
ncbi:MAG: ribosome rescue protein RqcH, partial [Candidatus Methanomethylicia archaeon]